MARRTTTARNPVVARLLEAQAERARAYGEEVIYCERCDCYHEKRAHDAGWADDAPPQLRASYTYQGDLP